MNISQEAREAAADLWAAFFCQTGATDLEYHMHLEDLMRTGAADQHPFVQAIAAAEARGMERAAAKAESMAPVTSNHAAYTIAAAIRALID